MKKIVILFLLIAVGLFAGAQTMDTVRIVSKAKKFKPSEHILLMFEVVDTVDASGSKMPMSRSYYFSERNRTIGSVREYHNPKKPEKGTQVIYTFGANKLSAVTVIPPRSTCRNCASRYYFSNDSLVSKQENGYTSTNTASFISQGHNFLSKIPADLPWGYFNDEVIVNGQKKKIKKSY